MTFTYHSSCVPQRTNQGACPFAAGMDLQSPAETPESVFTPGKSTTDRILALRVLVERRREFRQEMLAAYVDLKKAYGIPARITGLLNGLYSGAPGL